MALRRSSRLQKAKSVSGVECDLIQQTLPLQPEWSGSNSERFHDILSTAEAPSCEGFSKIVAFDNLNQEPSEIQAKALSTNTTGASSSS